jgi:16S rRNA (guanine(966)-N(2))-methyltransferase RsmD
MKRRIAAPMRITGGIHRSRPLRAPRGSTTRPTSDRVREALFGILASAGAIEGANVLDLYAGTGALGIEALSRGAARATFVESSRFALDALNANIAALGLAASTRIIDGEVERSVRRIALRAPFDVVLADPPWAFVESGEAPRAVLGLLAAGLFSPDAWVVLEHSSRTPPPRAGALSCVQTRAYGDTTLTFYKTAILEDPSPHAGAKPPSD